MKKILVIVVPVALIIGILIFGLVRVLPGASATAEFQTERLEKGSLQITVGATGSVRSRQSAQLTWRTSGTVGEVKVNAGDPVTRGQELATLAQDSLPQHVILARADLISAQRALDDLVNSKLQQAQALKAVEDARNALDDLQNPQISQAQALEAVASAQKAVENAERQLAILTTPASQAAIDQSHANLLLAENKLNNTREEISRLERLMKKVPAFFRSDFRKALNGLQLKLATDQISYNTALNKYNQLQEPADPTELAAAQADLQKAQAEFANTQREWERLKDGPSQAEIATAEANLADAQREWERLKDGPNPDDLAAAQARVEAAQAALAQVHITAPFDGVITQSASKPGNQVASGDPAFRLDDLSRLLVDVPVSEVDINRVALGQPVLLTFDSVLGQEYHGKVVEVAPVGTLTQGVTNYLVEVELKDADQWVKPGMTAAVTIVVSDLKDALLIPNRAVRSVEGKRVVYVLRNNQPEPVEITLGQTSEPYSELASGGLQVGDFVVLNPPSGAP